MWVYRWESNTLFGLWSNKIEILQQKREWEEKGVKKG